LKIIEIAGKTEMNKKYLKMHPKEVSWPNKVSSIDLSVCTGLPVQFALSLSLFQPVILKNG